MTYEERIKTKKQIADAINNARLDITKTYTRGQAVAAVTTFLYRLYDFYELYDEKEIHAISLASLLSKIC